MSEVLGQEVVLVANSDSPPNLKRVREEETEERMVLVRFQRMLD